MREGKKTTDGVLRRLSRGKKGEKADTGRTGVSGDTTLEGGWGLN